MRKYSAGGAIGMLLTLLIIAVLFIIMVPSLKNTGTAGFSGSSIDKKSVEEQVNKQVEEIENKRRQTIQYNNQAEQNDY